MITRRDASNYKDNYQTVFIDKEEITSEFNISYDNNKLTERAGELIIILVENIVFSRKYNLNDKSYVVTETLIDSVIMYIMENWYRLYSKEKGNAFSYFTSIIRTQAFDFLRDRYGKRKRLSLYGQKLKYRDSLGKWQTMVETSVDSEDKRRSVLLYLIVIKGDEVKEFRQEENER